MCYNPISPILGLGVMPICGIWRGVTLFTRRLKAMFFRRTLNIFATCAPPSLKPQNMLLQ